MCEQLANDDIGCGIAHQVTQLCYDHYKTRLCKNGKPQKNCEWTLLASVVQSVQEGIILII